MVVFSHWRLMFDVRIKSNMSAFHIQPEYLIPPVETTLESIYSYFATHVIPWIPFNFSLAAGGVLFFFLISGFVILASLQKYHPGEFIIERVFRVLPTLFFALLAIYLLRLLLIHFGYIEELGFSGLDFLMNALLISDVTWTPSIEVAIWTLLIEAKFYILMSDS